MLIPLARLHGSCLHSRDPADILLLSRQIYRKTNSTLSGELALPSQFQHLLELPAIDASITKVLVTYIEAKPNRWELVNQTVELSCGINKKVFVGMELSFDTNLSLTVVEVKQDSSTAKAKGTCSQAAKES